MRLPTTATAPFCPSEIEGSVKIPPGTPLFRKILLFMGPGLLISVGYMDPGNWATDIEAGSRYGYALLFMILFSSVAAIILQNLSARIGVVSEKDLAHLSRLHMPRQLNFGLWILAELAIIATDIAEVLGSALAFKLLFGCSLAVGVVITSLDTVVVLALQGRGFRRLEAIILTLITTIGVCYAVELWWLKPPLHAVLAGFVPDPGLMNQLEPWYIAIGILGATIMPHNLYLHSSIVKTRVTGKSFKDKLSAIRMNTLDTTCSLSLAFVINAAILIMAGAAFHAIGHKPVTDIDDAYHLLEPLVGGRASSFLFAIGLLAAGQSSTFTGTIAGQVLMEGFLELEIPCWQRRLITRTLALLPAFCGVLYFGEHSVGKLLVASQVVLSLQLPFAIYPMLKFGRDRAIMGRFRIGWFSGGLAWFLFLAITAANLLLVYQFFK